MKKSVVATSIALALTLSGANSFADNQQEKGKKATWVAGSLGFIGAVAAGPIGLLVGAIGGESLGKELDKADEYESVAAENRRYEVELADIEEHIRYLEGSLSKEQELSELNAHNLEFQVLFHTGNGALNDDDQARLDELAKFLQRNPELNIRVSGYADPRGDSDYNQILSSERSNNVKKLLEESGVEANRIESYSFGATHSEALDGDIDAYALERRVTIEVYNSTGTVATVD